MKGIQREQQDDLRGAAEMKKTYTGPGELKLELDAESETPALVLLGAFSSTFDVALGMGEVGDEPVKALTVSQKAWLTEMEWTVERFLENLNNG